MRTVLTNPFTLLGGLLCLIGMAISYVIGRWVIVPILSAVERAHDGNGMPTPLFLILGVMALPVLAILWLESVPDTFRDAAAARRKSHAKSAA